MWCRSNRTITVVVTLPLSLVVGCSSTDDPDDDAVAGTEATSTTGGDQLSGDADEPVGSTSVSTAPTSVDPTTTTTPIEETAVPAGLVLGDPIESTGGSAAVTFVDDSFLAVLAAPEQTTVMRSDDAVEWTTEPVDLPIAWAGPIASDGQRVVVYGWRTDDPVPAAWTSVDAGRTWTALPPFPTTPTDLPYVSRPVGVGGLAVAGDRVVVVANEPLEVDWRAYSIGELGVDHGHVTEMSGGASASDEVQIGFEDGFQLTLDTSVLGVSAIDLFAGSDLVAYAFDGTLWTRTPIPWMVGGSNQVVHGPGGFATVVGQPSPQLIFSDDGVTWSARSVPRGLGQTLSLTGSPAGYALAGEESIAFSPDGIEWETVLEFEDQDLNEGPKMAAGGTGGFLFLEVPFSPESRTRALWSTDGLHWDEVALPTVPADDHTPYAVVVGDTTALIAPITVRFVAPLPSDIEGLRAAIASSFVDPPVDDSGLRTFWPPVTEPEGACIAEGVLDRLGEERVRELGIGAFPFHLLSYALDFRFEPTDAEGFVDVLSSCTDSWELFLVLGVTAGTDLVSEETARCIADGLDDETAREILVLELDRPYDQDPGFGLGHLEPLVDGFERCANQQELSALDWN